MANTNVIKIYDKNGNFKIVDSVPGLTVMFTGNNSVVELYEPIPKIRASRFKLSSNCSIVIKQSRYYIDELVVNQNSDNSKLFIGENFACYFTLINFDEKNKSVTIGNDCMFAMYTDIRVSDAHSIIDRSTGKVINKGASICIGDNVWIAKDCKIMKGVTIADNCIVGANSCVTKSIVVPYSLIVGTPAKVKKSNVFWDRLTPDQYNVFDNKHELVEIEEIQGEVSNSTIEKPLIDIQSISIPAIKSAWNSCSICDSLECNTSYLLSIEDIKQISGNKINYCHLAIKDIDKNQALYITNMVLNKRTNILIKIGAINSTVDLRIYAGIAGQTENISLQINSLKLIKLD